MLPAMVLRAEVAAARRMAARTATARTAVMRSTGGALIQRSSAISRLSPVTRKRLITRMTPPDVQVNVRSSLPADPVSRLVLLNILGDAKRIGGRALDLQRKTWVRQIETGQMSHWKPLAPSTVQSKARRFGPEVAHKPMMGEGKFLQAMMNWPIEVRAERVGEDWQIHLDLIPEAKDPEQWVHWLFAQAQDMFLGHPAGITNSGVRKPGIPARPLVPNRRVESEIERQVADAAKRRQLEGQGFVTQRSFLEQFGSYQQGSFLDEIAGPNAYAWSS